MGTFTEELIQYEDERERIQNEAIEQDLKTSCEFLDGDGPVLISAPHAFKSLRYKGGVPEYHEEDAYTYAIAKYLNKKHRIPVLINKKPLSFDPNYFDVYIDDGIKYLHYKSELKKLLSPGSKFKLVLDLHGANTERPFDVDIGDMYSESLVTKLGKTGKELLKIKLEGYRLNVKENHTFPGGEQNTITKFVSKTLKIDCLQLEINEQFRNVKKFGDKNVMKFVTALIRFIDEFKVRAQEKLECIAFETTVDYNLTEDSGENPVYLHAAVINDHQLAENAKMCLIILNEKKPVILKEYLGTKAISVDNVVVSERTAQRLRLGENQEVKLFRLTEKEIDEKKKQEEKQKCEDELNKKEKINLLFKELIIIPDWKSKLDPGTWQSLHTLNKKFDEETFKDLVGTIKSKSPLYMSLPDIQVYCEINDEPLDLNVRTNNIIAIFKEMQSFYEINKKISTKEFFKSLEQKGFEMSSDTKILVNDVLRGLQKMKLTNINNNLKDRFIFRVMIWDYSQIPDHDYFLEKKPESIKQVIKASNPELDESKISEFIQYLTEMLKQGRNIIDFDSFIEYLTILNKKEKEEKRQQKRLELQLTSEKYSQVEGIMKQICPGWILNGWDVSPDKQADLKKMFEESKIHLNLRNFLKLCKKQKGIPTFEDVKEIIQVKTKTKKRLITEYQLDQFFDTLIEIGNEIGEDWILQFEKYRHSLEKEVKERLSGCTDPRIKRIPVKKIFKLIEKIFEYCKTRGKSLPFPKDIKRIILYQQNNDN